MAYTESGNAASRNRGLSNRSIQKCQQYWKNTVVISYIGLIYITMNSFAGRAKKNSFSFISGSKGWYFSFKTGSNTTLCHMALLLILKRIKSTKIIILTTTKMLHQSLFRWQTSFIKTAPNF